MLVVNIIDETVPVCTIRTHQNDEPWITPRIIKARQRAYTNGDKAKYKHLSEKLSSLVAKAKETYYQPEAEGLRKFN